MNQILNEQPYYTHSEYEAIRQQCAQAEAQYGIQWGKNQVLEKQIFELNNRLAHIIETAKDAIATAAELERCKAMLRKVYDVVKYEYEDEDDE